ncbi:CDK2-associated and cullin domain-containing protein 1-like isoform X3 [Lycorma delicatula]|uniref:CDK2-associated and cullin domain-containing protein 1-like isoform X3 n=1 Tax=Lycorma delicatula TaxID=130591 RepID=UPI003F5157FA
MWMAALSERDELDVSQMSAAFPAINPRPAMESDEHNERYKELYWKAISKVIADILNPNNNTKICFEEVYSLVYKCVCDGFSESLRMDLLDKCITHLHEVNQQLDSCVILYEGPRKVVETVCALNRALDAYLPSIQQIYSVCGYMNKLYSEETPEASLHSTLLICFCQIVCDHRLDAIMNITAAVNLVSSSNQQVVVKDTLFHTSSQGVMSGDLRGPSLGLPYTIQLMFHLETKQLVTAVIRPEM